MKNEMFGYANAKAAAAIFAAINSSTDKDYTEVKFMELFWGNVQRIAIQRLTHCAIMREIEENENVG